MDPKHIPVIVGVGRVIQKEKDILKCVGSAQLGLQAIERCMSDAGLNPESHFKEVAAIATVEMFYSDRYKKVFKSKPFSNFSLTLAKMMKCELPKERIIESATGGNGPQFLVNYFAEKISCGEIFNGPILIGGVELCSTFDRAVRFKENETVMERVRDFWVDKVSDKNHKTIVNNHAIGNISSMNPKDINDTAHSLLHGGYKPINCYAMIDNAGIHAQSKSGKSYLPCLKERAVLFSDYTKIASKHSEYSWFTEEKTAKDLLILNEEVLPANSKFLDVSYSKAPKNRMLAFPYSKNIVARDEVDMSAFICMMSLEEARKRDIDESKIIYFYSGASGFDKPLLPLHSDVGNSEGMYYSYKNTLENSGLHPEKIDFYDIYSCFPSAVYAGIKVLKSFGLENITADRITTTGGLPYHGGPGSNYSAHALCALVDKLRGKESQVYGMICANGGILAEHSCGIYSNRPRTSITVSDTKLFDPIYTINTQSLGKAEIVSWTVEYSKSAPYRKAIIICQNIGTKHRFFANSTDKSTVDWILTQCRIGCEVEAFKADKPFKFMGMEIPKILFKQAPTGKL